MAAPNQTRLKILGSILHLEQFTVADLCQHAGIERSQVYRILADLQEEKALDSAPLRRDGEVAERHRPSKRYVLTDNLDIRERLEIELNSFLPDSEDAKENRQLARARQSLNALSIELIGTSFIKMDLDQLRGWQADFRKRLDEVQRVLKRAFWESETDFSKGDHADHPILKARLEFDALESRFVSQIKAQEAWLMEEKARDSWSNIFSTAVATLIPMLSSTASPGPDELLQCAFKLSAKLVRDLGKKPKTKDVSLAASHDALLRYLSSWELDLRDARSSSDALAALAKNCIVYGKHTDIAYQLCSRLVSQNEDYRSIYNYANLAHLAERNHEAYESWFRYIVLLRSKRRNSCATQSLVARVRGDAWSAAAYEEAVQIITRECKASVSAFSETPFDKSEQVALQPRLYNPLFEDVEGESPLIAIGEPLAQQKRIYVVSSEVERPFVVGLPRVVRANLLCCGISEREAWDMSIESAEDERIIKVDWFRSATQHNREIAQDVLASKLSAAIVNPGTGVERSMARTAVAG